jgi:hypothetical protein
MSLPIFTTTIKELSLLQTTWASILNPVVQSPTATPVILKNVQLVAGLNIINHMLGRKLLTWKLVRQRALASIYDTQDSNQHPELTLQLVSSAPVVVDLEVS